MPTHSDILFPLSLRQYTTFYNNTTLYEHNLSISSFWQNTNVDPPMIFTDRRSVIDFTNSLHTSVLPWFLGYFQFFPIFPLFFLILPFFWFLCILFVRTIQTSFFQDFTFAVDIYHLFFAFSYSSHRHTSPFHNHISITFPHPMDSKDHPAESTVLPFLYSHHNSCSISLSFL